MQEDLYEYSGQLCLELGCQTPDGCGGAGRVGCGAGFFPLFKEFSHHWNFSSTTASKESITEYINSEYGVLPGQVFFTSNPLHNLVLFVAWWPWGNEGNVSMRVGLIPWNNFRLRDGFVYHCMKRWLHIVAEPAAPSDAALADKAASLLSTRQD